MDRVIEKKTWTRKRILTIVGIVGILVLIGASYFLTSGKSRLNVESERITISEVKSGPFKEFIPVNGVVLPITTIYLDALEGGRVEEKYVEDGAIMKKDQPILRLSNTDLQLNLVQQQTSVYNLLTQMQISQNQAEQNKVTRMTQLTDVTGQLKEAERIYLLNKKLYEQKVIGGQEFKQSENNYYSMLEKKSLSEQIVKQDSVSGNQQLRQAQQSYKGSQEKILLQKLFINNHSVPINHL